MYLIQVLPICSVFLPPSSVLVAAACQGGIYAELASIIAVHSPAKAYCSSQYPVPPVTRIVTGSTATSTSTVTAPTTTFTTTVTAAATTTTVRTLTDTSSTETDTTTETDTETTTLSMATTSTLVETLQKRQPSTTPKTTWRTTPKTPWKSTPETTPKTTPTTTPRTTRTTTPKTTTKASTTTSQDAKASAWSSILSEGRSVIAQICTCLESPQTILVSTTASTTVTSTTTPSATTSSTVTPTATTQITTTNTFISSTKTTTTTMTTRSTTTTTTTTITTTAPRPTSYEGYSIYYDAECIDITGLAYDATSGVTIEECIDYCIKSAAQNAGLLPIFVTVESDRTCLCFGSYNTAGDEIIIGTDTGNTCAVAPNTGIPIINDT